VPEKQDRRSTGYAVWTGEPAFTCLCANPGSGPSERGEHRPIEWGRRFCRGLSSTLGVARCGRRAGCVLCALWAVSAAVSGGGGRGPGGVSISSSSLTDTPTDSTSGRAGFRVVMTGRSKVSKRIMRPRLVTVGWVYG